MNNKLAITVDKTIEALARIERFLDKYGDKLTKQQIISISKKIEELRKNKFF